MQALERRIGTGLNLVLASFSTALFYFQQHTGFVRIIFNLLLNGHPFVFSYVLASLVGFRFVLAWAFLYFQ